VALSQDDAVETARDLLAVRGTEATRLDLIRDYMRNRICRIYVPRSASAEYKDLVSQSRVNIMPLIVTTVAQNLFSDGYRAHLASVNAPAWQVWQDNRMDARQSGIYRSALTYGASYATALPGTINGRSTAVIKPYSPRALTAVYDDPINDEWPVYALIADTTLEKGKRIRQLRLLDETHSYRLRGSEDNKVVEFIDAEAHNLGVTPVVRWLNEYGDIDDGSQGEVEPLMPLQDQLQQTTFGLLMAQHYAAFRQRWATGMAIAEDEAGNPIEPFNAAVNRVWQNTSPDGKFGDFAETDLSGYLNSRKSTLAITSAVAQVPPHALLVSDGISNLSAEALAAIEAGLQRKVGERKTSFGESNEQLLRLAGKAAGIPGAWEETSAQIVWRDTESRSLAQIADAYGKIATMLGFPVEILWERLPGITQQDIERARELIQSRDSVAALERMLNAESEGQPADTGAPARV
jgi:hypothetical protein